MEDALYDPEAATANVYGSVGAQSADTTELHNIYKKICDKFLKNAEDGDELDVYMVTAFLKYYNKQTPDFYWGKYWFYCFKCVVCALVQTFGMIAFLSYVIKENYKEDKIECSMEAEWDLRTVATLFSVYISVWLGNMIMELTSQGLYENVAYMPSFLANEWVYLGLYCNAFTLMCATYGSFLLIFTADSTLDIVLNSVALYFIIDLDNQLVDHVDYLRIENWMKKKFNHKDYFSESQLDEVKFIRVCGISLQVAGRQGGCNNLKLVWVFVGGLFVYLAYYLGCIGAIVAPFLIAVCY